MGAFDVTLKVFNIAGHNTLVKPGYIEVGPSTVSGITGPEDMRIYPNPTSGQFTVQFDANGKAVVKILDQLGNMVFVQEVNQGKALVSPSELAPGIYFIRVIENKTGKTRSGKLIIQ